MVNSRPINSETRWRASLLRWWLPKRCFLCVGLFLERVGNKMLIAEMLSAAVVASLWYVLCLARVCSVCGILCIEIIDLSRTWYLDIGLQVWFFGRSAKFKYFHIYKLAIVLELWNLLICWSTEIRKIVCCLLTISGRKTIFLKTGIDLISKIL